MENNLGWDVIVEEVSKLALARENYQKLLGKIAADVVDTYGLSALKDLSASIKEVHGLSLAPATLKSYLWVHRKTSHLNLPDDLAFAARQYIASSGDPEMWAHKIIDAGLSGPEAIREMRAAKGLDSKKKKVLCPSCGEIFFL